MTAGAERSWRVSFSSDIKKELCRVRELTHREMSAMLYGMLYAARAGETAVQTGNPDVAAAARALSDEVFPTLRHETIRLVKKGGSLYTFAIRDRDGVAERFGDFSQINSDIVCGNDSESGAFLRGVFAACGSVTDPEKEYHLEIVLQDAGRAERLQSFICEHGMMIKSTLRSRGARDSLVLYAKESELIEDFLTYIGAGLHSLEIMQVKIEKDLRNRANRSVNCDNANLDKTVAASERSCRDIEYILSRIGADSLKPDLRETALLRLENRESSLGELCRMFDKPISRSGLNHRLKRLSAMAEELRRGE